MKFILASSSPRRMELLNENNLNFEIFKFSIDEDSLMNNKLNAEKNAINLSLAKAKYASLIYPNDLILAADTIVSMNDKFYGKPSNDKEAFNMLKAFSGQTHKVTTGVTFYVNGAFKSFAKTTKVTFKVLKDEEIWSYIQTNECFGKAGSYAVQGLAKAFVNEVDGDIYTVVGLPINECLTFLKSHRLLNQFLKS